MQGKETMKFLYKILLWNVVIIAVSLSVGGYFFVNFVFETSMEREIKQSMEENSIMQFAFETAALNIPSRYNMLQDVTIQEIGMNLKNVILTQKMGKNFLLKNFLWLVFLTKKWKNCNLISFGIILRVAFLL